MPLKCKLLSPILLALACLLMMSPSLLRADSVIVGQLVYDPLSGSAQLPGFTVYDYSGPTWGDCFDNQGACSEVDFTNTSLSVTFANSTVITRSPNFTFSPNDSPSGGYLYGDNPGDDTSNSFQFNTATLGDGGIISFTFSGTLSPASFTLGDGSTFDSSGAISIENDAYGDTWLMATTAPPASTVPEPGTWWLLGTGMLGLVWFWRRRQTPATPASLG